MRSDLIENFKIVNRKYDNNPELFFQLDEDDRRGRDQKLSKKRFRLNIRKYAFSNRVVIVGIIRQKPVLTHARIVCGGMLASVNSVNIIILLVISVIFSDIILTTV